MKRAPEKIFNIINHCACAYEQSLSCIQLFATPWTATRHPSLFMRFFRQEYWSGLPVPSPPFIQEKYCHIKFPSDVAIVTSRAPKTKHQPISAAAGSRQLAKLGRQKDSPQNTGTTAFLGKLKDPTCACSV